MLSMQPTCVPLTGPARTRAATGIITQSMLSMQPTCVPLTGPAPRHGYRDMLSMQPTCVPRHGYPSTDYSMLSMQPTYTNRSRHCNPPFGVVPRYFPSFGEYTTYFYSLGLNEGPQHLRA